MALCMHHLYLFLTLMTLSECPKTELHKLRDTSDDLRGNLRRDRGNLEIFERDHCSGLDLLTLTVLKFVSPSGNKALGHHGGLTLLPSNLLEGLLPELLQIYFPRLKPPENPGHLCLSQIIWPLELDVCGPVADTDVVQEYNPGDSRGAVRDCRPQQAGIFVARHPDCVIGQVQRRARRRITITILVFRSAPGDRRRRTDCLEKQR